tara:strand:- start:649 stop:978 length:330 start_codon:yes stop_codon:yes gene_type:complete
MENLYVITIKKCSYCKNLIKLLNKFKFKFIEETISENNKKKYKTTRISTFPQVYFLNQKEKILIGGYTKTFKLFNYIIDRNKILELPIDTTKNNKLIIYKFLSSVLLNE